MDLFLELTKNVIIHKNQGFALYFYLNGQVIEQVSGKVSTDDSDDITYNTNFRLASVSKQFIAYSIVELIFDNKLNYNTSVLEIFSELPNYFEHITIRNLLNHTSGIYDYEDMPHSESDKQIQDIDILDFLKTTTDTYFEAGTKYKYSNTAYILLGLIVEKVSGMSIVEFIENNIFKKAYMDDSKVNVEGITKIKNRAYGHLLESNKLLVKD